MAEVAILGCGPAGLLCAHAVTRAGHTPYIISQKVKSNIPGSQHLQAAIPDLTPVYPDATVLFVRVGTKHGYAEKVYGDPYHPCGWPRYNGVEKSWNLLRAYDKLWDMYSELIHDVYITHQSLLSISQNFPLVLSTLPQNVICYNDGHEFDSVPYWIKSYITPEEDVDREVIVFNGLETDHWYRWSILGRKTSIESTSSMEHAIQGVKALGNSCDCWKESVVRLGRWAEWKHGVLLHHAYSGALAAASTLGGSKGGSTT